jgi:chemotaxis protein methyltransferase CheR
MSSSSATKRLNGNSMNDEQFARLKARLQQVLGLDLEAYKEAQMRRRLTTYISRLSDDIDTFIAELGKDEAQLKELRDMITINVTEFFRDEAQWAQLRSTVLPDLLERGRGRLNIWSAGCSTGQEPYSIAMYLAEAGALDKSTITATDFDREALGKAKDGGPYSAEEMKGVPRAELTKHFDETPEGFVAKAALKKTIKFREVNLLADKFSHGYDLVVCRNVMIYFKPDVKGDLVQRFRKTLKPDGVLFIGATEALLGDDLASFNRLGGNFYRNSDGDEAKTKAA